MELGPGLGTWFSLWGCATFSFCWAGAPWTVGGAGLWLSGTGLGTGSMAPTPCGAAAPRCWQVSHNASPGAWTCWVVLGGSACWVVLGGFFVGGWLLDLWRLIGALPRASLDSRPSSLGSLPGSCSVSFEPELFWLWSEPSLWSVCYGSLWSELLLGLLWWLPPGE